MIDSRLFSVEDVSGYATTFCRFLSSKLVPYVDDHFRTCASKEYRALIGHWALNIFDLPVCPDKYHRWQVRLQVYTIHCTPIITYHLSVGIPYVFSKCWLSFVKIAELEVSGKSFGGSGVAHAMLDQECSGCFKPLGNVSGALVKPPCLEMEVTPACASPWLRYFLLGSPSLAWDNRAFFRLEQETYKSRNPLNALVYASCGGKEQGQIQNLQDFKQLLDSRAYPDLTITTEIVEGRQQLKLSVQYPVFVSLSSTHAFWCFFWHGQMIRYVAFSTLSKSFRIFILAFCPTLPVSNHLN